MGKTTTIITTASWEERFLLGFKRLMEEANAENVILYFYKEYAELTRKNRLEARKLCDEKGTHIDEHELEFHNPVISWGILYKTIRTLKIENKEIIVDITTTPREAIWTILNLLEEYNVSIEYVYHSPDGYNDKWLSRDPGRPRIVYKLGGIAQIGTSIGLLVLPGYDIDRVKHMIAFFEPNIIFVGIQKPSKPETLYEKIIEEFKKEEGVNLFDLNAFTKDHGYSIIEQQIGSHLDNYNFILTSLGPKLSSIALYRFHKNHPETALAYAPSNEYNPEYSYGIGKTRRCRL